MDNTIKILKALGDETRLRIINLLIEGELCVCNIESILHISQTKASRHLTILKNAGLVTSRKAAQWTYYSINLPENTDYIQLLITKTARGLRMCKQDLQKLQKLPSKSSCTV